MHRIKTYIYTSGDGETFITKFVCNNFTYTAKNNEHYQAYAALFHDRLAGVSASDCDMIKDLAKLYRSSKKKTKFKESIIKISNLINEYSNSIFHVVIDTTPPPVGSEMHNNKTITATLNKIRTKTIKN